jgi:PadR family transcriptional regulator PadR
VAKKTGLIQGTLDALVLRALADGPRHGYGVVAWISEVTDATLQIDDGALYTSLHRMENRGWLKAEWSISPKGRKAKYYALTPTGRRRLKREQQDWSRYAEAVFKVFAAPQPDRSK